MQLLYSRNADAAMDLKSTISRYRESIQQSYDLFSFALYTMVQVAEFAGKDREKRRSKHLPSDEDKNFKAVLYTNDLLKSLYSNNAYQDISDDQNFEKKVNADLVKEVYKKYAKEEDYIKYATKSSYTKEDHKQGLLDFFRFIKKNEIFEEILEDHFYNWNDDKSLIIGSVKKLIKMLPLSEDDFMLSFAADEDTTEAFGLTLIEKIFNNEDDLLEMIKPNLQNWDADRLAQIDLILLKMALSEMLYFSTIPTKVTLNEYVELSKNYSTDKSKEFINGILDKMMKSLSEDGKIQKKGRGLIE